MEFKDLPCELQIIAAHTLAGVLKEMGCELKNEPAKELARNIRAAFIDLHSPSEHAFAQHDSGQE